MRLLVVRHADRVGVLASILGVIREAQINIEDMQNIIFSGGEAACARLGLSRALPAEALARIEQAENVYAVSQVPV